MSIAQNLAAINERMAQAARAAGRDPAEVALLAVSKTKPAEAVNQALAVGQCLFGENYVQEAAQKIPQVNEGALWHFIGHLQSNKAKKAAGLFDVIQTVDRAKLAKALSRHCSEQGKTLTILLQVSLAGETQKSGCPPEQAPELARLCAGLPGLRLAGLMTMPPFFDQPEKVRPYFAQLRRLAAKLAPDLPAGSMAQLSMGMSGDFEAAIAEGATLVRVGSAVFGPRS